MDEYTKQQITALRNRKLNVLTMLNSLQLNKPTLIHRTNQLKFNVESYDKSIVLAEKLIDEGKERVLTGLSGHMQLLHLALNEAELWLEALAYKL